ncbi:unnamed protein product [Ilex paraguariensis]|uniref:Small auxin up regulated protein n=1 Tax=Ilex paraguariensis TaxID=185542 RepID=A0ABC8ULB9_9AQUA
MGEKLKRYIVPIRYLSNPIFQQLLEGAAEEYGYPSQKAIVLACNESIFQMFMDSRLSDS